MLGLNRNVVFTSCVSLYDLNTVKGNIFINTVNFVLTFNIWTTNMMQNQAIETLQMIIVPPKRGKHGSLFKYKICYLFLSLTRFCLWGFST